MKKAIKFLYWLSMSSLFLALWYREKKISRLNHYSIDE